MTRAGVSLVGGTMFGFGLGIAGVANPVVINNFLDLAGPNLDFTLLILFATAVTLTTAAYQTVLRSRARPIFDPTFYLPTKTGIDRRLVGGALIFGFGWALSGYCVGPALASSVHGYATAVPYLVATAVGVLVHDFAARALAARG